MAMFNIENFEIYNTFTNITHVSWEIALDSNFTQIVDSIYKNEDAVSGWYSSLPYRNGRGHYGEETILYIRCKIHVVNATVDYDSEWFIKTMNDVFSKREKLRKGSKVVGEIERYEDGSYITIW